MGGREGHFDRIYSRHADDYHALVAREDRDGNLPVALRGIVGPRPETVIELGAGTGRLTALLAPGAGEVYAFDRSQHMLDRASRWLSTLSLDNVTLAVADNRSIALPGSRADIVIEGWSFGHAINEAGEAWEAAAAELVAEMTRLAKPGAALILIETLGTGCRQPAPPGRFLAAFYDWLESAQGFARRWIRTDYLFPSRAEAERLLTLFFGTVVDHDVLPSGQVVVPECTGIWWKRRQT